MEIFSYQYIGVKVRSTAVREDRPARPIAGPTSRPAASVPLKSH
jgi:hypothetical protein